jgi:hypothetical protein
VPGVLALLVGPTLGHVYAGRTWSAWLGARLIGVAIAAVGTLITLDSRNIDCGGCGPMILGWAIGGTIFGIATVGEIVSAPSAATDFNRAQEHAIAIVPLWSRDGLHGLAVTGEL